MAHSAPDFADHLQFFSRPSICTPYRQCRFDGLDSAGPLELTRAAAGSCFFSKVPPDVLQAAQEQPLAMENHVFGAPHHAAHHTAFSSQQAPEEGEGV